MLEIEIVVTRLVQSIGAWLLPIMEFFSSVGNPPLYIIILLSLCWCFDYKTGIKFFALVLFSAASNSFLKAVFKAPRPFSVTDEIIHYHKTGGYGMPSGHAQVSFTFYGAIAFKLKKTYFTALCGLMIFGIGLSRIYLGVHSVSQVIVGFAIGLLILCLTEPLSGYLTKINTQLGAGKMIALCCGGATALILTCGLFYGLRGDFAGFNFITGTSADIKGNQVADHFIDVVMFIANMAGLLIGYILFKEKDRLKQQGMWGKKVLLFVFVLLTLAFYIASLQVIYSFITLISLIIPALIVFNLFFGLWIAYLAPRFFLKIKLMELSDSPA